MLRRIASAVVCFAAIATPATASDPPRQPPPGPPVPAGDPRPVLSVVPSGLARTFGIFAQPRSLQDELPPDVLTSLYGDGDGIATAYGTNPALAKRADVGIWLLPGTGSLCVVQQPPGGRPRLVVGCGESSNVDGRGLVMSHNAGVVAVMPDGVRTIRVGTSGRVRTARVRRNAVSMEVKRAKFVRFTLHGKKHVVRLGT